MFLITLFTAGAYGPTYDEPFYVTGGVMYARWWGRVFTGDFSAFRARPNRERRGDTITNTRRCRRWPRACRRRVRQRAAGADGGAAAERAVVRARGGRALSLPARRMGATGAVFSALALATLPNVFAHAHFIAMDIAVMCWFFLTAAAMAVALQRNSWGWSDRGGGRVRAGAGLQSQRVLPPHLAAAVGIDLVSQAVAEVAGVVA